MGDRRKRVERRANSAGNLVRIYGKHSVRAVFLARPQAVRRLILAQGAETPDAVLEVAGKAGVRPEFMDWPDFLRVGGFTSAQRHQGVFILAEPREARTEKDFDLLEDARVVLALDQISDPQNLATMVRCAAFFGVDAVLVLRDRSADATPEVARQAVGGVEFVEMFRVTNLSQSLDALKDMGFAVFGLDERGDATLAQTIFPQKVVLVVGAEGDGLRQKTKRYCDRLVRIPGGRQGVESLNAGVAASIALAEIFREGRNSGD
jgi:23S rRNA (guanosine2251-2'-O)-methyltransferase